MREAIAWAESVLGIPVMTWEAMQGGLTSTMLRLRDATGTQSVLRLMTEDPWRAHGPDLTCREAAAQGVLATTAVPAPASLGLDPGVGPARIAAHLMTMLPGTPTRDIDDEALSAMAQTLATIHDVRPTAPFRTYQSWAWEAKRVVPDWTSRPRSWQRAFDLLGEDAPNYEPTFLHRDYSHRNLLWTGRTISGVVDWVETSTGPAWLDAAHAATTLAITFGTEPAQKFLRTYGAITGGRSDPYWLIMDAVGFLPPPGRRALFDGVEELGRLDEWLGALLGE